MRQIWTVLILGTMVALAGCASRPHQTDATAPTVTYSYGDDDEYDQVAERANDYCDEQYDMDAVLVDRDADGSDYEATFACK